MSGCWGLLDDRRLRIPGPAALAGLDIQLCCQEPQQGIRGAERVSCSPRAIAKQIRYYIMMIVAGIVTELQMDSVFHSHFKTL